MSREGGVEMGVWGRSGDGCLEKEEWRWVSREGGVEMGV